MSRKVKLILDLETGKFRKEIDGAAAKTRGLDDSIDRTTKSTNALGGAWKKFGGIVGGLAVGETIRRGFTRSLQKGKELQQGLADLSAITGITGKALDGLGEEALNSSVDFGTAAIDIVEAQKLVASALAEKIDFGTAAGIEELKQIANQATLLKTAAGIDLRTAVEATAGAINQFNLDASESARIINVLAADISDLVGPAGITISARSFGDQTLSTFNLLYVNNTRNKITIVLPANTYRIVISTLTGAAADATIENESIRIGASEMFTTD